MEERPSRGRETLVGFLLLALLGGAGFVFLNFISFGIFFWALVLVMLVVAVGYLHYLLWGQSLTREVAGEREENALRESMQADVFED